MIRSLYITLLILSCSASAENKIDAGSGLKIAPGWRLVKTNCTACHSAKIITRQHNTRNSWINTIRWMQNKQGLRKFDQKTEKQILAYLSNNYPAVKTVRRANLPANALPDNPLDTSRRPKNKKYKVIVLKKK